MTTLAADVARVFELGNHNHLPVVANDIIYEGAAVGDDGSGFVRPLITGDVFRGFCQENVDNSTGSAGQKYAWLRQTGFVQLAIGGVTAAHIGRPVYASDDDTFTITTGGSYIGIVERFVSTGVAIVKFDAMNPERDFVLSIPIDLASITTAMDVVTQYTPGFYGRVKKAQFLVTKPVTTSGKAVTLNVEIGTTDTTGGVITLTSANCNTLGAVIAGSAITNSNNFTYLGNISVEATAVTAFAEGQGVLLLTIGRI